MTESWLITHSGDVFRWGLCSTCFNVSFALIFKAARINPNIWHIPRNIFRLFIYIKRGQRYVANINGTWRLIKGGTVHGSILQTKKLFPDEVVFFLGQDDFQTVTITETDEEIKNKIINLNLCTLKLKHPFVSRGKHRKVGNLISLDMLSVDGLVDIRRLRRELMQVDRRMNNEDE